MVYYFLSPDESSGACGLLAQLVEHIVHIDGVTGSSPVQTTQSSICKGRGFFISLQNRKVSSMSKFVPRPKLSKKARKELDTQKRTTWAFSPVTKKVESKKIYNRKKAAHVWKDDSSMSGFCCNGDGTAANAARGSI